MADSEERAGIDAGLQVGGHLGQPDPFIATDQGLVVEALVGRRAIAGLRLPGSLAAERGEIAAHAAQQVADLAHIGAKAELLLAIAAQGVLARVAARRQIGLESIHAIREGLLGDGLGRRFALGHQTAATER